MLKEHTLNYDGGAPVVRAPSIKEETLKVSKDKRQETFKNCIWSVALYGSETWTVGKNEGRVINAFETWCWRGMLKIQWTDRITNDEVF